MLGAAACDPDPGYPPPPTRPPGPDRDVVTTTFTDVPTAEAPATGVIGVEGGAVRGQTDDGRSYQLLVPPGALAEPVEISVQPLERTGPPFGDELLFAFDLQPEGLTFARSAALVVNVPGLEADSVLGIGSFGDDGQGFHRGAHVVGTAVVLEVDHFSTARATSGATAGEQMAWAEEVARAFTPSSLVAEDGARYAAGVEAQIRVITARASGGAVDEAAVLAVLQTWLDQRIEGYLLPTGGRDRLVQAVNELDRVLRIGNVLLDGEEDEILGIELQATDMLARQAWLALYESYLPPACTAPLLDATDAFQHPIHIFTVAQVRGWDGFDLPQDSSGWCAQLRIEDVTAPETVPDESVETSTDTTPVSFRYGIRTPRPAAFPGEPLDVRFDEGPLRLAERLDAARMCLRMLDGSGTVGGETEVCEEMAYGDDTFSAAVDPSGLADLQLEAEVSLVEHADFLGPTVRSVTAPRVQRLLTLSTPSTVLPAPPHSAPVCATVTTVTGDGEVPEPGVEVSFSLAGSPGSTGWLPTTSATTDDEGRACTGYHYDTRPQPAPGSAAVYDQVTASWTDHLDRPRETNLVLEPDWVDLRVWNTADGRTLTERLAGASATGHHFSSSRFSTWQAALVRRAATPDLPELPGAVVLTPDGGPSGTFEAGGGITVGNETGGAVAIGGSTYEDVGIDLSADPGATVPFPVCVCYEPAYASGSGTLRFAARLDGAVVRRDLAVTWDQLTTPPTPPEPEPEPEPDPDGVVRPVVYAPPIVGEPGSFRLGQTLMSTERYLSDGTLIFRADLEIEGQPKLCPRLVVRGIIESPGAGCGWTGGHAGDATSFSWVIEGGSSRLSFEGEPQPFAVTLRTGGLQFDPETSQQVWVENVIGYRVIPGEEPEPDPGPGGGGPGSPGWRDECRDESAGVHELSDPNSCNDCA
jgi:hypothetical protein